MIKKWSGKILPDVLVIQRKITKDHRGLNADIFDEQEYLEMGISAKLGTQQNYSTSNKNVIRGLHGDNHTFKLICCTLGSFMLVVVNYEDGSPYFGKWERFILTAEN